LSSSPKADLLSQNHRLDCQLHPLKTQPLARRPQVGRVRADFVDSLVVTPGINKNVFGKQKDFC
jgi:hypothetical protein